MKILIDGDACKKTGRAIEIGKDYEIPVHIYCDLAHYQEWEGAEIHLVDIGKDSADFAILKAASDYDIIISNDIGLALIAEGRGISCMNGRGVIFTKRNLGTYMQRRYLAQRSAHKTKRYKSSKQTGTHFSFGESLGYLIRKNKRKELDYERETVSEG